MITIGGDSAPIDELLALNERVLEDVYPTRAGESAPARTLSWDRRSPAVCKSKTARPRVAIPVFPGTNCEYDSARACLRAGLEPEIVVVRNLTASALEESRPGPGEGHPRGPDPVPARRLLRRRRARRLGQVHLLLPPQRPAHRRGS